MVPKTGSPHIYGKSYHIPKPQECRQYPVPEVSTNRVSFMGPKYPNKRVPSSKY